ncbi:MAG: hypothetical protein ACOCZQ_00730 [Nanoarchaeota archaeon]
MKYLVTIFSLLLVVFGLSACAPDVESPEEPLPTDSDEDSDDPEEDDIEETIEEGMISDDEEVDVGDMV